MPEPTPRRHPPARGAAAPKPPPHVVGERRPYPPPNRLYLCAPIDEERIAAVEAAQVAEDPWCRPALDRRRTEGMGEDPRRPYRDLDDLALEAAEADLPEEDPVRPPPMHVAICDDLGAALVARYEDRDDVFAVSEMDLFYDAADERAGRVAPDVMVVFGVPKLVGVPKRHRRAYVLWRERKPPSFALEVLSRSTWERDMGVKHGIYANIGVRDYLVFDPDDHIAPRLQGFGLHGGGYRPLPSEMLPGGMRGVYSAALGLYLCHEEPWPPEGLHPEGMAHVRWYDPVAGEYLKTPMEIMRLAKAKAEARLTEARLGEAEARRGVEAANRRAVAEGRRAEIEAQARRAAEFRVAELEARIREITS